jgi:hypothetical protein
MNEHHSAILLLARTGLELWSSQLIGGAPPSTRARFERMRNPRVGDLVVEITTSGYWIKDRDGCDPPRVLQAIGYFDHMEDSGEEGRLYVIKLLHNRKMFRWSNASFVTIMPVEGWKV